MQQNNMTEKDGLEVPDTVYKNLVRMLILSVVKNEQGKQGKQGKKENEIKVSKGA